MFRILLVALFALAACGVVPTQTAPPKSSPAPSDVPATAQKAARQFVEVVSTMEPIVENECRSRNPKINCDFQIVVDDRPSQSPNAFQTIDTNGRPILAFNLPLIASVQNTDELAFVMGHEAAHHILNHISRMQENASVGAVIFSGIAAVTGAGAEGVQAAQELGAAVGARSYSKDFELEADELGTVITARAGYDPVRGARFFTRIPDPGDRFMGSHPPNAARVEIVRRTAAAM